MWTISITMRLDRFSNLLSQRHGVDKSMAGSVISTVIGHLTQSQWGNGSSGIGNLFSQGNNYSDDDIIGGIQYTISNLMGQRERGQLNQDHSLIHYVCFVVRFPLSKYI